MNNIFNAPNNVLPQYCVTQSLMIKSTQLEKYILPIASCCLVLTFIIKIIQFILGKNSDTTE